ncbi:MAG: Alpha-galactosidase, partial [Clostridia bacterium]|nr:Alpha-galactosidase [Clostridia bacterium]
FKDIALSQVDNLAYSGPYCFNDLDMLTVGMYGKGSVGTTGCNDIDYKTQFTLWCLFSSPLMLGSDIRNMTKETKALITNKELLKINQDPEARPAFVGSHHPWSDNRRVFVKHLADGEFAIGFFNLTENDGEIPFYFDSTGIPANSGYGFELTDILTGENIGVKKEFMCPYLVKHDSLIYRAKLVKV